MNVKPEEVLVEAWIPTYKTGIRILHNQLVLVQIRSMLFILEHIARFPFDLFGEHPGPFWHLVRQSLETSVVVGLWRILLDTDPKALTLRKLRNQVMSNAIDEATRRRIANELRSHDVDNRIKQIEHKITRLRHRYFAHLEPTEGIGSTVKPEDFPLTFEELRELATAAHDLINVIGMNSYYMTLFSDYDPAVTRAGERIKPDVESLFDEMVARSEDLRMPEVKPYHFQFYWKHRTPRQRAAFNEYRKKFGLPEVATEG
jgi:hypothetical protein